MTNGVINNQFIEFLADFNKLIIHFNTNLSPIQKEILKQVVEQVEYLARR